MRKDDKREHHLRSNFLTNESPSSCWDNDTIVSHPRDFRLLVGLNYSAEYLALEQVPSVKQGLLWILTTSRGHDELWCWHFVRTQKKPFLGIEIGSLCHSMSVASAQDFRKMCWIMVKYLGMIQKHEWLLVNLVWLPDHFQSSAHLPIDEISQLGQNLQTNLSMRRAQKNKDAAKMGNR